ncbi:MAG: RNA polymerase factor sigma-54 [Polynucleobacter sp.]|nr:RNA polymerase factor sigma-54 [Polynucleobacter sp.]
MKLNLGQKLGAQLTLTPQLQQAIRLLQLSVLEIEQELLQAAEDNPFLELDITPADDRFEPMLEASHYTSNTTINRSESDDVEEFASLSKENTLLEHLIQQINLLTIPSDQKKMVLFLAGSLDEDGYLRESFAELKTALQELSQFDEDVLGEQFEQSLKILQNIEANGIGARTLNECLEIQLNHLSKATFDPKIRDIALRISNRYLDELGQHQWDKLKSKLRCTENDLRAAVHLIRSLDPHPANQYASLTQETIAPDVFVKKNKQKWEVYLNPSNQPKIDLRKEYVDLLKRYKQKEENDPFFQKYSEAKTLVKAVRQRSDTILAVAKAIVDKQQAFFENGDIAMRPLLLKEIADIVGMHESTISRVTTQKYLTSSQGTYAFKYFFSTQINKEQGSHVSSKAIQTLIKQMVDAESPSNPLSDSLISDMLNHEGYQIARRTITKYRELLQIPPVHSRKKMNLEI